MCDRLYAKREASQILGFVLRVFELHIPDGLEAPELVRRYVKAAEKNEGPERTRGWAKRKAMAERMTQGERHTRADLPTAGRDGQPEEPGRSLRCGRHDKGGRQAEGLTYGGARASHAYPLVVVCGP